MVNVCTKIQVVTVAYGSFNTLDASKTLLLKENKEVIRDIDAGEKGDGCNGEEVHMEWKKFRTDSGANITLTHHTKQD